MAVQDEMEQFLRDMEEWRITVTNNWEIAKKIVINHIQDEDLKRWETTLHDVTGQINQLNELIHTRSHDNNEELVAVRKKIKDSCTDLYHQYTRFQEQLTSKNNNDKVTITELGDSGTETDENNRPMNYSIPPGGHRLPPLPYDYAALEPYINREIMKLHHDKHHQSYVDGLNKAEKKMVEARETGNFELIRHWEREAAFNGAGHYLHTIFWNNMSPNGGGKPKGALLKQIEKDFGSYRAFKHHFSEAAKKVEGVGWAILVWAPRAHRLAILQAEKHQMLSQWDVIPLLVLDVWEHAYYLQYKTNKDKYVDNWWNIVNWNHVAKRFQQAEKLRWEPF